MGDCIAYYGANKGLYIEALWNTIIAPKSIGILSPG